MRLKISAADFDTIARRVDGFRTLRPHWPESACIYQAIKLIAPDIARELRPKAYELTLDHVRAYIDLSLDKRTRRYRAPERKEPAQKKARKLKPYLWWKGKH